MTDRDFERGRGGRMAWRDQGDEFCGQPGPNDRFGQQEMYGGQGYGTQGQSGNQMGAGYEQRYGGRGMGWQPGQPASEAYGAPGFAGQGQQVDRGEGWRHGHGHESWEHGQSGRGFWGQGHPAASQQGFSGQGAWRGQTGPGVARQSGGWPGSSGSWEQGYGGPWSQGSQSQSGGQGYGFRSGPAEFVYEELWMIPGPYAGRGPRGYQRSDARIEEDICERFTRHGQLDASDIEVMVANGEVTMTGTVESRQAKRLAEDILDSISGVKDVHNQLRVQQGNAQAEWSQTDIKAGRGKSSSQTGRNDKAMVGASHS